MATTYVDTPPQETYLVQVRDGVLNGSKICHHKLPNYRREGFTATPLNWKGREGREESEC